MFCIPDVNYFKDFNMILNDNVIDCFLVENVPIEQDNVEKISNESPQQNTYKYKKTAKVRNKKFR
jgi:hypothetical protein